MLTPRQNAELLISFVQSAIKTYPSAKELYQDFNFHISEEDDKCTVQVSEAVVAYCYNDGTVMLGPSLLESITGIPLVPILLPITKESFKIALIYYTDMRVLAKSQNSQLVLLRLSNSHPFESGGLWC
jgi:hypothetical protein